MTLGLLKLNAQLAALEQKDQSLAGKQSQTASKDTHPGEHASIGAEVRTGSQRLSDGFDKIEAALPESWQGHPVTSKLLGGIETWTGQVLRLNAEPPPPPKSAGEQWLEALPHIMDKFERVNVDFDYLRFGDSIVGNPEATRKYRKGLLRFSEYQPKYLTDPSTGEFLLDKDGNKIHAPPPKPTVILPDTSYGRAHFEVRPVLDENGEPMIDPRDGSTLSLLTRAVLDYQGGEARKMLDPVPIGKRGLFNLKPGYLEVDCFTAVTPPTMTFNFGLGPNAVQSIGKDGDVKYENACIDRKPGEDVVTTPFESFAPAPPDPGPGMEYDWMFYFQMQVDTLWQRFLQKYIDAKRGDKFLWANNPTFGFVTPENSPVKEDPSQAEDPFAKLNIRENTWPRRPGDIARFFSPLFTKEGREAAKKRSWFFNPNSHYLDENHEVQKIPYDLKKWLTLNEKRKKLDLPEVPWPRGPALDWAFVALLASKMAMAETPKDRWEYLTFRAQFDPDTFFKGKTKLPIGDLRILEDTEVKIRYEVQPVEETIEGQKVTRGRAELKVTLEPASLGKGTQLNFGDYVLKVNGKIHADKIELSIPWDQVYNDFAKNKWNLKTLTEEVEFHVEGLQGKNLKIHNTKTKQIFSLGHLENADLSFNKLEKSGERYAGLQLENLRFHGFKMEESQKKSSGKKNAEALLTLAHGKLDSLILPTPSEDGEIKVVARGMETWVTAEEKAKAEEAGEEATSFAFHLPQFQLRTEQAGIPKAVFTLNPDSQALSLRIPRLDSNGSLAWTPLASDKTQRPMEELSMRGHSTLRGVVFKREVEDKGTDYKVGFRYRGSIHETEFKSKLLAREDGLGFAKLSMQEGETLHELAGRFSLKAQQPTDPKKEISTDYRLALDLPYAELKMDADGKPVATMGIDLEEGEQPSTIRNAHFVFSPGKIHLNADVEVHPKELHAPNTELRFKGLTIEPHFYNVNIMGSLSLDLTPKGFKLENGGEIPLQASFEIANSLFQHKPNISEAELSAHPERRVIGTNLKINTVRVALGHLQKLYFENLTKADGSTAGRMTQLEAEDFVASGFKGGGEIWVYTFLWDWLPGVFPAFGEKVEGSKRKSHWPKPPNPKVLVAHLSPKEQNELKDASLPGGYKNFLRLGKLSIGPSERYSEDPGLSDIYTEDFIGYARESGGNGQFISFGIPDISVKQVRWKPEDPTSPIHRRIKNKGAVLLQGFLNNPDRHYSLKFNSKNKSYHPVSSE